MYGKGEFFHLLYRSLSRSQEPVSFQIPYR